jgi:MFS family permease
MLALMTATATFVTTIAIACMPALFQEISDDLGLNLVQIGTIWGMSNLGGVFVSIIAGFLSDRFGMRSLLSVLCLMAGLTGSLRGLSNSYLILALTVFTHGAFRLITPVTLTKAVVIWFKDKNLALAMGMISMGMGLGLTLGPMISATVLSPALGGWRNVMYFFGALSAGVGLLWIIFGREPHRVDSTEAASVLLLLRQAFSKLVRLKSLWLIGITSMFRVGAIISLAGYLPLYLRDARGWDVASADGTLAAFFAISTLGAVPLSFISDRIGSRKIILYAAIITSIVCLSLLPVVEDGLVLPLILLAGLFVDGFASVSFTMLLETKGLALVHSGVAAGIVFSMAHTGNVILPPLGNSLASINPGAPIFLWAASSALALVTLAFAKETGWRHRNNLP